jgi:hypothetical protein
VPGIFLACVFLPFELSADENTSSPYGNVFDSPGTAYKHNDLSFYFTVNRTLSGGDSNMNGSLMNYEKRELASRGVKNKIHDYVYKLGLSYDIRLLELSNIWLGAKADAGYLFLTQDYNGGDTRQLLRHRYYMAGPELTMPLIKGKSVVSLSCYFQYGLIANGTYTPLVSAPGGNGDGTGRTSFSGRIINSGVCINMNSDIVVVKSFINLTHCRYDFDNLRYQSRGEVSNAVINDFCFGIGAGVNF